MLFHAFYIVPWEANSVFSRRKAQSDMTMEMLSTPQHLHTSRRTHLSGEEPMTGGQRLRGELIDRGNL